MFAKTKIKLILSLIILSSLVLFACADGTFVEMKENVELISMSGNSTTYEFKNYATTTPYLSISDRTPSFEWSEVNGADEYQIIISGLPESEKYKDGELIITTNELTYTIEEDEMLPYSPVLADGSLQNFTWTIRPKNKYQYMPPVDYWNFYIIDDIGPSISIDNPADQDTVTNDFTVNITATDNTGINKVEISINGGTYQVVNGSGSSYSIEQFITTLGPGVHTFTAKVTDIYGNEVESETITIYIPPSAAALNAVDSCVSNPSFSFSAVQGASYYVLEIFTNSSYSGAAFFTTTLTNTTYNYPSSLPNSAYYWRVKTYTLDDGVTLESDWSIGSFDTTVITPASNLNTTKTSLCAGETVNLTWNTVAGNSYDVYYGSSVSDTTGDTFVATVSAPQNTLTSSITPPAGNYYWKIITKNGGCTGNVIVASVPFIVYGVTDATVTYIENGCPTNSVTMKFSSIAGQEYDIYYSLNSNAGSVASDTIVYTAESATAPTNTVTPTIPSGIYYWKIIAKNPTGPCSGNITVSSSSFSITNVINVPDLTAGSDICEGDSTTPTWTTEPSHTYELYLSNNNNTGSLTGDTLVSSLPHTINSAGTYYWKVLPKVGTCSGNISASGSFEVKDVTNATGVTPNGSVCLGNTVNLTWSTTSSHTYDVYYSTNNSSDLTGTTFVETVSAPNNTLSSAPTPAAGVYYWKVVAKNGTCTGAVSPSPTSFTVTAVTDIATITPSGDVCFGTGVNVSWTTTAGHDYNVYYANNNANDLTGTTFVETVSAPNATLSSAQNLSVGANYYWKIVPKNGSCTGNIKVSAGFNVNAIPTNPAISGVANLCSGTDSTITWSVTGGDTYDVDFYNGSSWITPSSVGSGTATQTTPAVGSGYKWRINTTRNGCPSSYTESGTFNVNAIPTNPTINGVGDLCNGNDSVITWTAVGGDTYDVDFYNGSAWVTPDFVGSGTATQNTPAAASGYKWRINTTRNGCTSSYTESAAFSVNTTPTNPAIVGVADICAGSNSTVTWSVAGGGIFYIEFYNGSSWVTPDSVGSGTATQNTPAVATGYKWRIQRTLSGCTSTYTESGTFNVNAIPTNPAIVGVANLCNGEDSIITWTAVGGDIYDVQFYNGSAWVAPSSVGSGTATQTTPAVATGYKWRIKTTRNSCTSTYTESSSFDVNAIPTNPAIVGVANICNGDDSTITWSEVGGGTFSVEFYNGSAWIAPSSVGSGTATQTTPAVATGYKWRIQRTLSGCTSAWTESSTFDVNAIPTNPAIVGVADICAGSNSTITWSEVGGGTFTAEFYNGSAWVAPDSTASGTATKNSLTAAVGYKWRIQRTLSGCTSAWTESGTFTVAPIPAKPTITAISNNCITLSHNVSIAWSTVTGEEYYIEAKKDTGAYAPVGTWTSSSPVTYTINSGIGGVYTFRMKARNATVTSCESVSSDEVSATLVVEPPQVAGNDITNDGGTDIDDDGDIEYKWTALSDITNYEIYQQLNVNPPTTQLTNSISGAVATISRTDGLADGTYYWMIRSIRTNGSQTCYGDWSAVDSFEVSSCPTVATPSGLSTPTTVNCDADTITFTWGAIANAEHTYVEFTIDGTWTDNPDTHNSNDLGTGTSYGPITFSVGADKTYRWRVKANRDCDATYKATEGSQFQILNKPAQIANLTRNGIDTYKQYLKFGFDADTYADEYEIQFQYNNGSWVNSYNTTVTTNEYNGNKYLFIGTGYTLWSSLTSSNNVRYLVRGKNKSGAVSCPGDWSNPATFTSRSYAALGSLENSTTIPGHFNKPRGVAYSSTFDVLYVGQTFKNTGATGIQADRLTAIKTPLGLASFAYFTGAEWGSDTQGGGVCLSTDEQSVFVANSDRNIIHKYDVGADGITSTNLANKDVPDVTDYEMYGLTDLKYYNSGVYFFETWNSTVGAFNDALSTWLGGSDNRVLYDNTAGYPYIGWGGGVSSNYVVTGHINGTAKLHSNTAPNFTYQTGLDVDITALDSEHGNDYKDLTDGANIIASIDHYNIPQDGNNAMFFTTNGGPATTATTVAIMYSSDLGGAQTGTFLTQLDITGLSGLDPYGIDVTPDGSVVYVADSANDAVVVFVRVP